jgi:hypothetical protein
MEEKKQIPAALQNINNSAIAEVVKDKKIKSQDSLSAIGKTATGFMVSGMTKLKEIAGKAVSALTATPGIIQKQYNPLIIKGLEDYLIIG